MAFPTRLLRLPILIGMIALLLAPGCSDDITQPSSEDETSNTATLQAEFSAAGGDFEIETSTAGDPSHPVAGPFLIRGTNIRYDEGLGALLVDLTVENRSRRDFPYPAVMTFLALFPSGVQVLNSDNDETGPGAQINFDFAQDDLFWNPGEVSLPRTVQFLIEPDTAMGFVARIDVGLDPSAGSIGGVVFHDRNENGMMDADEAGIPGITIALLGPDDMARRTRSFRDGTYRFENLQAGVYTVRKVAQDGLRPTTPTELVIVLPDTEDGVADFLNANFGCIRSKPPVERRLRVGDIVEVKGMYKPDPDRIMAAKIEAHRLRPDEFPSVDFKLAGPVTDLNRDRRAVAIAGTWLIVDEKNDDRPSLSTDDCSLPNIEVGDRVVAKDIRPIRIDVSDQVSLLAERLDCWERDYDLVEGFIDRVEPMLDSASNLARYRIHVLNTWVVITADTKIEFDDEDPEPPTTGPDALVRHFVHSYNERNIVEFDALIDEDFQFFFPPEAATAPEILWDRARELAATRRMFSGEPGTRPNGDIVAPIVSIALQLKPLSPGWTDDVPEEFAGTLLRAFQTEMVVVFASGDVAEVVGVQEFYVSAERETGATRYQLKFWRELGSDVLLAATETASWASLKLLYVN